MRAATGQGFSLFFFLFSQQMMLKITVCWHLAWWHRRGPLTCRHCDVLCVFSMFCRSLPLRLPPRALPQLQRVFVCGIEAERGWKARSHWVANKAHPSNPCDLRDIRSAPLQCSRSADRHHLRHLSVAYLHPPSHLHLSSFRPLVRFSFFFFFIFLFGLSVQHLKYLWPAES